MKRLAAFVFVLCFACAAYAQVFINRPTAPTLDPPISTALLTKGLLAFGFDRLVAGYSGNSVRLFCVANSAQQDFGFSVTTGKFDTASVLSWCPVDVNVVQHYDQMGGAKLLTANGTVALVRSGIFPRFATSWSSSDGQLTRSTTEGGVGGDLGNDTGSYSLASSGLTASTGDLEFHLLTSNNERKAAANHLADDPWGANSTQEFVLTYGFNTNVRLFEALTGGNLLYQQRFQSTATDQDTVQTNSSPNGNALKIKQFAQSVYTFKLTTTTFSTYTLGRLNATGTLGATNQTNLAAGAFDNGVLVVGNTFNTTTNSTLRTTLLSNAIFGGLIVTKALPTDLDRYVLEAKLSAVGQQHRIKSLPVIKSYFDEIVMMKDVNPSTGVVSGINSQLTLQYNISTGSPNFNFSYTQPDLGIKGIYAPDDTNYDNGFKATTTYFTTVMTGTVMSLHYQDPTGNDPAHNSNLARTFIQGTGNPYTGNPNPDWSMSLGYDHDVPSLTALIATSREGSDLIGTRHTASESVFGKVLYDGANASMGTYNRNTSHNSFLAGETISSVVWGFPEWAGGGSAPYQLDAPVAPPLPDNGSCDAAVSPNVCAQWPWKFGAMTLQIGTFQKPATYNRSDPWNTRKAFRLDSINKSYVTVGNTPISHIDGSIAINPHGGVVDSDDNAYIMTDHLNSAFKGNRTMFAFKANEVFTLQKIEEVEVNSYKFFQ